MPWFQMNIIIYKYVDLATLTVKQLSEHDGAEIDACCQIGPFLPCIMTNHAHYKIPNVFVSIKTNRL